MKTIQLWLWALCTMMSINISAQITQQVSAIQYFYNTDPGVGVAGNGGVLSVTPTADLTQTLALLLPGSLGNGINQLYVRVKDEYGRWSIAERRMFYITQLASGTRNISTYQWYVDSDPGTGIAGTGAVVPISPVASFNSTIAIALPSDLSKGLHYLYVRVKDDAGRWSLAERRMFYISEIASGTRNIAAYHGL